MLKLYPYGDKSSNLQTPFVPSSLQNIFRSSKGSKDMYTILNKNSSVPTAQRKWNTVFDINSNEWKQIYILPFKATAKIRVFFKNVWFMSLSPNQEFTCPRRFCTFSQPQNMCSMVSFSFWQKLQFASSIILIFFRK
jgi:hypothetical protein